MVRPFSWTLASWARTSLPVQTCSGLGDHANTNPKRNYRIADNTKLPAGRRTRAGRHNQHNRDKHGSSNRQTPSSDQVVLTFFLPHCLAGDFHTSFLAGHTEWNTRDMIEEAEFLTAAWADGCHKDLGENRVQPNVRSGVAVNCPKRAANVSEINSRVSVSLNVECSMSKVERSSSRIPIQPAGPASHGLGDGRRSNSTLGQIQSGATNPTCQSTSNPSGASPPRFRRKRRAAISCDCRRSVRRPHRRKVVTRNRPSPANATCVT